MARKEFFSEKDGIDIVEFTDFYEAMDALRDFAKKYDDCVVFAKNSEWDWKYCIGYIGWLIVYSTQTEINKKVWYRITSRDIKSSVRKHKRNQQLQSNQRST